MRPIGFAVPGSLDTPTGGYRYDRRVIADLRQLGHPVELVALAASFPWPTNDDLRIAEAAIAALPAGMPVIIDGLALGPLGEAITRLAERLPIVALIHHPLALEAGLTQQQAADLRLSETAALTHARAIVVTSGTTGRTLTEAYAVDPARITVAVPGVDVSEPIDATGARGGASAPFRFISVGSLIPRKGHLDLVAALAMIRDLDWTAEIIGDPTLDPSHAADVAAAVESLGLSGRIRLLGAMTEEELDRHYRAAQCFVLASHYEGYGMAYVEAIARGLAVVGTTGGAIPEAVGSGGELVAPGDVDAFAGVLRRVAGDSREHSELAARARQRAGQLPKWHEAADLISALIARI